MKRARRLVLAQPGGEQGTEYLPRPHAGQRAPCGAVHAGGERGAVHRVFYEPLAVAIGQQLAREQLAAYCGAAVIDLAAEHHAAARGSEFISVAELQLDPVAVGLTLRIFRPLLRKERQQHLLGGVFIVVTGKI